jgi:hypothetical protein
VALAKILGILSVSSASWVSNESSIFDLAFETLLEPDWIVFSEIVVDSS